MLTRVEAGCSSPFLKPFRQWACMLFVPEPVYQWLFATSQATFFRLVANMWHDWTARTRDNSPHLSSQMGSGSYNPPNPWVYFLSKLIYAQDNFGNVADSKVQRSSEAAAELLSELMGFTIVTVRQDTYSQNFCLRQRLSPNKCKQFRAGDQCLAKSI